MTITHPARVVISGLLMVAVCACAATRAHAQQNPAPAIVVAAQGQLQELVLRDGTHAFGRVEKVDGGRVTFRTEAGAILDVDVAQVVSANIATGQIVEGAFWPADSNPTRLFFAPTGRTLKRGESYFGVYEIYISFVQFGITDRFSIGGGTPLLFVGEISHPFWFTPKLQIISRPNTQASIGVMHFLNVDRETVGIAYGAVTQGSSDSALTVGLGWAYDHGKNYHSNTAVLMIGGEHRISRRVKFVTENYLINSEGMITGGFRFMGERLSADIGLIAPLGGDVFALPMVNFVWKMGK